MSLILNKIKFMGALWSPRRPSIPPDPRDPVSPSEGMSLGLLVANHWRSSPGNLWICSSSWQRGLCDVTKDTDLEMKRFFWSSRWDYLITWILESEEASQAEVQRKKGSSRRKLKHKTEFLFSLWRLTEEAASQGMQMVSGRWKEPSATSRHVNRNPTLTTNQSEQGSGRLPQVSKKERSPPNNLIWTHGDSRDFWHSELDSNNLVLL